MGNASTRILDILDAILYKKQTDITSIETLPLIKTPKKFKKSIKERKKLLKMKFLKEKTIKDSFILSFMYKIFRKIKCKVCKRYV